MNMLFSLFDEETAFKKQEGSSLMKHKVCNSSTVCMEDKISDQMNISIPEKW